VSTRKPDNSKHDLAVIGGRLSYIREKLKMSVRQFAEIVGLTAGNISNLENHKYNPRLTSLVEISKQLGLSLDWLVNGYGEPFRANLLAEGYPHTNARKPPHSIIIEKFKQQDLAWEITNNLYRLEQANPESLRELNELLEFKLQKLAGRVEYDRRQSQRRTVEDKDRAPDEERRIAERRIASGE
jgi:transcriptional regulator with XRE-family HTH domain